MIPVLGVIGEQAFVKECIACFGLHSDETNFVSCGVEREVTKLDAPGKAGLLDVIVEI